MKIDYAKRVEDYDDYKGLLKIIKHYVIFYLFGLVVFLFRSALTTLGLCQ